MIVLLRGEPGESVLVGECLTVSAEPELGSSIGAAAEVNNCALVRSAGCAAIQCSAIGYEVI
ncbi:MAG: hypothetical protein ABH848_05355 [Candidatus Omnitrophota bacterium]